MIYVLATDSIDATVFAARVLSIPARRMRDECRLVHDVNQLPVNMRRLVCRMTINFEAEYDRGDRVARLIVQTAERRGALVNPAFDLPATMDANDIEAWLAD